MKNHLKELVFEGEEREDDNDDYDDNVDDTNSRASKEFDSWIINWPADTASPSFSCPCIVRESTLMGGSLVEILS